MKRQIISGKTLVCFLDDEITDGLIDNMCCAIEADQEVGRITKETLAIAAKTFESFRSHLSNYFLPSYKLSHIAHSFETITAKKILGNVCDESVTLLLLLIQACGYEGEGA